MEPILTGKVALRILLLFLASSTDPAPSVDLSSASG